MNTQRHSGGFPEIAKTWALLQAQVFLKPIRDEDDYRKMVALADDLADQPREEGGPLDDLFDLVTELIGIWEDQHVEVPTAEPREVLRYLLESHDLKQKDLGDIASPTLISDILSGRRAISKKLAKALADRFSIDASVFL
ncbi:type II toxin-antitoxin system HigA family antitoxin [Cupriavidus sp. DF5525]|uniref:helix-turn-helix domain-containing protein n=1 Tax=Cupriavidus sp. DF5525 TaxID=3160989 RepID=UPI001A0792FB|nr:transcriptional regulator [Cupriavidus sp. UYMU48A]